MEKVSIEVGGREITIETGRIAKQAHGSVIVQSGETMVMVCACASDDVRPGTDFFPLTVDYREKTYAAGSIPGGYFKREARPSEHEILTMRLTDRPLRPLFPKNYFNEVQVMSTVISADDEVSPDILSMIGASAALALSHIPLKEPLGAVRVGYIDGQFIVNPTIEQMKESQLELVIAGTADAIMMVEGGAKELADELMLEALQIGHDAIKPMVQAQNDLVARCGKEKVLPEEPTINEELYSKVKDAFIPKVEQAFELNEGKKQRDVFMKSAVKELLESYTDENDENNEELLAEVKGLASKVEKEHTRRLVIERKKRADGRGLEDIRPISIEVGILPRVHGSALFTRGETQAIVTTTLGTSDDEQYVDSLQGMGKKSFMLHYNFPPYSVGEVKRLGSVGRREIGHGHLAERALEAMRPTKDAFPYTIRIVSDITESNGSSSMASVCGGSLSLYDAGVPLESMVSGIAMGLIKDGDDFVVLSDILGLEDHLGDMDFKVTGTEKGITAFQMDIKITGITFEIMKAALAQAKKGRVEILKTMRDAMPGAREKLSDYAPKIISLNIPVPKIKDVIGPGGKVIRGIIEETGVKIDIEDDGSVRISGVDPKALELAVSKVEGIVADAEVGKIYDARVVKIMDFGAFVEFLPGKEGLVHISQMADHRVAKVTDVVQEKDQVKVKLIEIDKLGRFSLSMKAAQEEVQS